MVSLGDAIEQNRLTGTIRADDGYQLARLN
jgi:hypothetical protein